MAISITKPTVGGSEDTWGTQINTALDTIVDAANGTSGTIAPDLSTLTINGTDVTATAAELNIMDGVTATTAELNILDGVTSTAAELNILDGVTATTAELNIMDGVTATAAEINKLDGLAGEIAGFTGVSADLNYAKDLRATGVTAAELDVLDGITATTAELNIMDGVTATTAEINKLDGYTGTATDLNEAIAHYVPTGGIIMWSGSVASIPTGWVLCDGTNSTPDLRNRFVVGAGDTYAVDATGGNSTTTLSTANLPAHTHTFSGTTGGAGSHSHTTSHGTGGLTTSGQHGVRSEAGSFRTDLATSSVGDHTHSFSGTTSSTGSGSSFDNKPPYYALAYIMKT